MEGIASLQGEKTVTGQMPKAAVSNERSGECPIAMLLVIFELFWPESRLTTALNPPGSPKISLKTQEIKVTSAVSV